VGKVNFWAPAQCNDRARFGMFLKIEVTMPTHNQYSIRGLFQEIVPILLYIPGKFAVFTNQVVAVACYDYVDHQWFLSDR
jgi:hemolysin-activating ACP:hemolysin acyltransferase